MGDSDSESDFELHAVHTVEDGFSDPPSDVPSEEPATEDDVEIGSDTDGADGAEIPDADGVQETDNDDNNDGKANNESKGKKRKRVMATDLAFRLRVCRHFHQCKNKKQTARKFTIQPKQVRDYLKQEKTLKAQVVAGKRKSRRLAGGGAKPKHPQWEKKLLDWVNQMQEKKRKVTRRRLVKHATRLFKEVTNRNELSEKLLLNWKKRNNKSFVRTKRRVKHADDTPMQAAQKFHHSLRRAAKLSVDIGLGMGQFDPDLVANMDETGISITADRKVLVSKGSEGIIIDGPFGATSLKRFATVVITVFRKEQLVKPLIIFRGQGKRLGTEPLRWDSRVVVHFQKDAWMDGKGMETVYVPLWEHAVKEHPHKKVLLADALGAHFKKEVLSMFHAANTWVCRIPEGTTSFLQYLDVYFFATLKDTLYNILDDVAEILEEGNTKRVSASEKRVLVTKAVADAWDATILKTATTRPQAFGQLGYTWGHGEVVSLRSLPDYKFDPDEAFADVCVTGADGAGAAPSAAVAHASSSVSNVKRQTTTTAFFK